MKHLKIASAFTFLSISAFAANPACTYTLDSSSVKVGWTAFKTTEKTPVKGSLNEVQVTTSKKPAKSLTALLSSAKATGQMDGEKKSDSGNPARDTTLFQKFFSLLAGSGKFQGSFLHVKGDDQAGTLDLALGLNGKKKNIPLNYLLGADGSLSVTGEFDMTEFGMDAALASLHTACEALHKGKDGVSKTWPNVGLTLTAKVTKDCVQK